MGLHTDLRIHSAATKLLDTVTDGVLQMRRDAKKPIGEKMIDECLDITTLIQLANTEKDKTGPLAALLQKKCRVEALLKVSLDKKLISPGHYALATQQAVNLGKQAVNWRNDSQRRQLRDSHGSHASA
jgi:hypothetical protein